MYLDNNIIYIYVPIMMKDFKYGKKSLILLMFFFILSCSKDEEEPYPVNVINERLTSIAFEELNSEFSIESKLIGDTLKCKILTILIHTNDTLKNITSEMKKNNLYIKIESSPNDFCFEDYCWAAHEISFDLLGIKPKIYNVIFTVNDLRKLPIEVVVK